MRSMTLQVVDDLTYRCVLYVPGDALYQQVHYRDDALYRAIQNQHCASQYLGELGVQRFAHRPAEARSINFNHASVMLRYVHYANVPKWRLGGAWCGEGTAMALIADVQPCGPFRNEIRQDFDHQLRGQQAKVWFSPRVEARNGHISKIIAFDLVPFKESVAAAA